MIKNSFRVKNELGREFSVLLYPVQMIAIAQFGRSKFIPTTKEELKKIVEVSQVSQCSHLGHVNSCFEWTHIVVEKAITNRNRQVCVDTWQKKCEGVNRSDIRTEFCGSPSCQPQCILTVSMVDLKDSLARRNEYIYQLRRRAQRRRREALSTS